jgi:hypothetical protein
LHGLPEKRLDERFRKIAIITRGLQLAIVAWVDRERLYERFRKIAIITRGLQLAMIAGAAREEAG